MCLKTKSSIEEESRSWAKKMKQDETNQITQDKTAKNTKQDESFYWDINQITRPSQISQARF